MLDAWTFSMEAALTFDRCSSEKHEILIFNEHSRKTRLEVATNGCHTYTANHCTGWWVKQNIPWHTIHRTVILKGMCQRQHVLVMCELRASTSSWVIPLTRRWGRINCQTEGSRVLAGCSAAGVNPKNIPNDPSCSFLWHSNKPSSLRTFCCCWKQKASDFDCLYDSYIIAQNIQ